VILIGGTSGHADGSKRDRKQIEEATRLQIFLDNSNFGPGKIDGKDGEFTRKAITLFKRSQGQADSVAQNSKTPIDTTGLDLANVDPVFTTYVVTKGDIENVGELPSGPAGQAKVKWLPYRSVAEAVAEKFHCDINFLKELNPTITEKLKEGDQVTVPNVKPFELSAVKALKPGSEAAGIVANELRQQDEKGQSQTGEAAEEVSKEETPPLSLYISTKEKILEVHDGEKLVAAFPVTVGSQDTVSPIGHWTVKAIAKLPNFRYDLEMLNEGERSSSFYMLPPGPNNPAGVIWIALNKKGIGIHGASDPDSIGRNASHGCIRLANWDVAKLAGMVKPGVSVVVE
jgi:lipoprotein-anchoring transpeptidase ErfK/SrfK